MTAPTRPHTRSPRRAYAALAVAGAVLGLLAVAPAPQALAATSSAGPSGAPGLAEVSVDATGAQPMIRAQQVAAGDPVEFYTAGVTVGPAPDNTDLQEVDATYTLMVPTATGWGAVDSQEVSTRFYPSQLDATSPTWQMPDAFFSPGDQPFLGAYMVVYHLEWTDVTDGKLLGSLDIFPSGENQVCAMALPAGSSPAGQRCFAKSQSIDLY